MEVEMKIRGLTMDPVTQMPIVVLKDINGSTVLPIWVGIFEANAIALEIEKVSTPRPMTHDLLKNIITDLEGRKLWHDQRIARAGFGIASAAEGDTDVRLRNWTLKRNADGYAAQLPAEGFALDLRFAPTQPVLLQGKDGLVS